MIDDTPIILPTKEELEKQGGIMPPYSSKQRIFINLSKEYAEKLGIPENISDSIYKLIHHPSQNEDFLVFITKATIWGKRAQREDAYRPHRKNILKDLPGFEIQLRTLYETNRKLFLGMAFYGREVEKSNVHIELSRFNRLYSIILIEYLRYTYPDPRNHISCYYLHHFLEELCREYGAQSADRIEEVDTHKLKDRLTYEPEMDQVESFVRESWSYIWSDYLKLRPNGE